MFSPCSLWLCGALLFFGGVVNAAEPLHILARHCVTCHNASDPKAGLDLSQAATALRGGDSGAVIVAGKPAESLLLERVADGSMPPEHDGRRLTDAEVATLKDWIAAGAKWPAEKRLSQFEFTTERRAGLDWWSLQPLPSAVSVPETRSAATAIDAFIVDRLKKARLSPSPLADRQTLIRRASLDLLGLPPTPDEVAVFAKDSSPDAFERLLDRLLASPHYGERWGRHWLDVVRYGESDGFEHDKYRDNSWPYRDYVIRSLNADLPYSQFVIDQLAGDALPEATRESIAATGFLVAGPWDEIQNVGASPTEKRRAREEQQEELIAAVSQTFLGLTVHCARCHDHKFDPVPQLDYYQLKAALDGVDHGNRPWQTAAEQQAFDRELQPLQTEIAKVKAELADLSRQLPGDARIERGADRTLVDGRFGKTFEPQQASVAAPHSPSYQTAPFTIECWAKLESQAGFNILVACDPKSSNDHWELYTFAGSGELSLYLPGCKPAEIKSGVNVVDGSWHYLAATVSDAEVQLFVDGKIVKTVAIIRQNRGGGTGPLQFGSLVEKQFGCQGLVDEVRLSRGLRTIESLPTEPFAADGATLGLWHFDEIEAGSFRDFARVAESKNAEEVRAQQTKLAERQKQLEADVKTRPRPQVYSGVRRQPEPTVLLLRGELSKPGPTVLPAAISAVRDIPGEWKWAAATPEAERRLKLAQWIAHPQNPLPWRVMANRIWQQHFGRGLVTTPSDFGFNGGQASHPELLDHLALELRREGSWKTVHRRIMETSTYQQASVVSDLASAQAAYAIDADNRLLSRFTPRRLEAETVRDAMLAVSGQLNRQQFGPSFKPFTVTVFNTHFYHLHDQDRAEFHRRTVYRAAVLTGRSPLLTALDCPAPSLPAPQRQATVTPLQALGLMNDSLVLRLATRLAERTARPKGESAESQIRELYMLTLGREPSAEEMTTGKSVVEQNGGRELSWALLNCSEFLYLR